MNKYSTRTYRDAVEHFKHPPLDDSGFISDDKGWSDRLIINELLDTRDNLFSRDITKGVDIDVSNYHLIPCLKMEEVSGIEGINTGGCSIHKSVEPLPYFIDIKSVTNSGGTYNYDPIEWNSLKHKLNSRSSYERDKTYYTLIETDSGSYLYTLNDDFVDSVVVRTLLSDPYSSNFFTDCEGNKNIEGICNPWDTPFKTDRDTFNKIMKVLWSTLPQVRSLAGTDHVNDTKDNTKGYIQTKI